MQRATDHKLQEFADFTEKYDFSIEITVFLKGAVITGTLISRVEYLKRLTEVFKSAQFPNNRDLQNALIESCERDIELIEQGRADAYDEKPDMYSKYLHLADFLLLLGQPVSGGNSFLLRLRIDEVDGWHFGSYRTQS